MQMRSLAGVVLVIGLFLVVSTLVASCSPDKSAPELKVSQVPTIVSEDTLIGDTGMTPDEIIAEIEPFTDVECLDCHTDEVVLKELAKPVEVTEGLSTGPG